MNIELVKQAERWDRYVESAAPESLYYRWVWRDVIADTFGHQPHYLAAVDKGEIQGVLPLVSLRSRLFGNRLVSIPFFSYGGVLANSDEAREKLLGGAAELAGELGSRHIELRQGDACPMSWTGSAAKVSMEIPLPSTPDEYLKTLSTGRRKKIRQGLRHALRAEWGGLEALPTFYKIFATNMRNLGTPVYPCEFFENQMRHLNGKIRILSMWDDSTPVAAAFLTAHGSTLELPWAATVPEGRKKDCAVVMYWTFIERAIEEGFQKIDLGRCTPGSGNHDFKLHWNPVARPLHWYYWLAPGASTPQLRPDNAKFKLAIEVWKRLPLAVANSLGPCLVRSIP